MALLAARSRDVLVLHNTLRGAVRTATPEKAKAAMACLSTPSARLLVILTCGARTAATTVSVTKEIWSDSAQSAIAAAKRDWAAADRGCVATIASATPPYLSYDGRDTTKPKLCRVDHGGEVDADKTTILAMVDSPGYLEQRGNWEAFLSLIHI